MDYELAIIGAGPAGFTASIYAVRSGIHTALFDTNEGGGLATIAPNIENYPGFPSISGTELTEKMREHAKKYVDFHKYEEITSIKKKNKGYILSTSEEKTYEVTAIIISTGTTHRKLPIKGAESLEGKGVSYCATCDGFFFKNKTVAVVGGGNSALIESVYLKHIGCKKIFLIHRRDQLRAEEAYQEDAINAGVEFKLNTIIKQVNGTQQVESLELEDTKTKKTMMLAVDGVFVSIGVVPHNELAKKLEIDLDEHGYIKVDSQMRTSLSGIYAAGDITGSIRQVITAAAEGAIAGLSATEAVGKRYPY